MLHRITTYTKRLAILLLFAGVLPLACGCPDQSNYPAHIRLMALTLDIDEEAHESFWSSDTIEADTLFIRPSLGGEYVASSNFSLPSFVSTAFAKKCHDESGYDGIESEVESVVITADQDFNGIAAGNDLSAICGFRNRADDQVLPFMSFQDELNAATHEFSWDSGLSINEKPVPGPYLFTVAILLGDGRTVSATTPQVVWE